jgi:hypothetical protein
MTCLTLQTYKEDNLRLQQELQVHKNFATKAIANLQEKVNNFINTEHQNKKRKVFNNNYWGYRSSDNINEERSLRPFSQEGDSPLADETEEWEQQYMEHITDYYETVMQDQLEPLEDDEVYHLQLNEDENN